MLMTSPDWTLITELIGKPYAFPSDPPKSFDCFSITMYIRSTLFNKNTPINNLTIDSSCDKYIEQEKPTEGCIVTMTDQHVGVYVREKIITALTNRGVCAFRWKAANAIYRLRYWELGTSDCNVH